MPHNSKEKKNAYMHRRYLKKQEELRNYQRKNRNLYNKLFLLKMKGTDCCEICGENRPAVLQFHHINPEEKLDHVLKMMQRLDNLDLIQKELDKCIVLCSNCHDFLHTSWTEEEIEEMKALVEAGEWAIKRKVRRFSKTDIILVDNLYNIEGLSLDQIGELFHTDKSTVHAFMVRYDIPRRNRSEARIKIQFQRTLDIEHIKETLTKDKRC